MSYRRRKNQDPGNDGGVKGPSSALTSFLREQGINAENIRSRYERSLRQSEDVPDTSGTTTPNDIGPAEDEPQEDISINLQLDSDEEEIEDSGEAVQKRRKVDMTISSVGAMIFCLECDQEFNLSLNSKKIEKYGKVGFLCPSCTKIQIRRDRLAKKHEIEARKKRKRVAAALLDKKQFKLPSLQDICIHVISDNIDGVEILGDIGNHNKIKISRILAKNRSLTNRTLTLFLDNDTKELELWDCSKLDKSSLDKIPAFCPQIEKLILNMCGQLHNDNLNYFGSKLTNLKHLELNGPFLINNETWQNFFESSVAKNLKHFHLRNTHRFSTDSLVSLLENCGKNLESLTLSRLDGLNSKPVYDLLPHFLTNIKHLELSYPHQENLIDDDLIIALLALNCESLETLILDKCSGLTNRILSEGLKLFGAKLTKLSLADLDQIDDTGIGNLFDDWKINHGLHSINIERCISLGDKSVFKMLEHSCETLVQLNMNSVKNISKHLFGKLSRTTVFPSLTSLDVGFVRSVDDSVLAIISRICPKLEILEIYGNNRCTDKALFRENLTVIGRQTDSI
ncbi:hypothetical protein CANINC_003072 [Pichia inconspicua]|uniref:DNA repair protein rhp7 treble clef domain-containing protein n=1 Tax=Pichia inconspicua TaxID=52247 RepID=A0A4T0WZP9_9ASCO|nr:hypothetical protein CANINC_003072 [[Candida] inconspicua]